MFIKKFDLSKRLLSTLQLKKLEWKKIEKMPQWENTDWLAFIPKVYIVKSEQICVVYS